MSAKNTAKAMFPQVEAASRTPSPLSNTASFPSSSSLPYSSSASSAFETTFSLFPDSYGQKLTSSTCSSPSSSSSSQMYTKEQSSAAPLTDSANSRAKPHQNGKQEQDEKRSSSSRHHKHRRRSRERQNYTIDTQSEIKPILSAHRQTQDPPYSYILPNNTQPRTKPLCAEYACSYSAIHRCDMEDCNQPLCTWHARKSLFTGHVYCSHCVENTIEGKLLSVFGASDTVHGDSRPDQVIAAFHESPHWMYGQGSSENTTPPTALTEGWLSGVRLPGSDPNSDCIIC